MLKIAAKHADSRPLELLVREFTSAGTSMAPGFTGMGGNRPKVMPLVRLFSIAVDKSMIDPGVEVVVDGEAVPISPIATEIAKAAPALAFVVPQPFELPPAEECVDVPLIMLAWGRSGDKGNDANIGIVARETDYLPNIRHALTSEVVRHRFVHYSPANVERYDLPGIGGLNFLLRDVLGGGGIASLRNDPQGKAFAQILLSSPISVARNIFDALRHPSPRKTNITMTHGDFLRSSAKATGN